MQRILSAAQIRALDAYTIQHHAITSWALMERACQAWVDWFIQRFDGTARVGIVSGTGNNGGDGLGIARLLKDKGYDVTVWIVRSTGAESPDFVTNLRKLDDRVSVRDFSAAADGSSWKSRDVLVDAIFGSGLNRAVEGVYAEAIQRINASKSIRVAVDVPSGLLIDRPSAGVICKAHFTVTFQLPRLAFMMPENHPYVGEWSVVRIGLDKDFIRKADTPYYFFTRKAARKIFKPASRFDHKGTNGRALLISGSFGKMGAAVLSARGALRGGAGLVTVHVPHHGVAIVQTAVPEAMVSADVHEHLITGLPDLSKWDVIGIGPGIGTAPITTQALRIVLTSGRPLVLDADALNLLAQDRSLLDLVPPDSILTPHPGEFERLVGPWADDFERLEKLRHLAQQLHSVVVLKGAFSAIAAPGGDVCFNSTGNPGMATGGSGDVLTGILTALRAQGYSATETALLGVFVHGLAGDLAATAGSMQSLTASDLITALKGAFKTLEGAK